jgi:hypothetical protein
LARPCSLLALMVPYTGDTPQIINDMMGKMI